MPRRWFTHRASFIRRASFTGIAIITIMADCMSTVTTSTTEIIRDHATTTTATIIADTKY